MGLGQYVKYGIREMAMARAAVFKGLNVSVGKEIRPRPSQFIGAICLRAAKNRQSQ